MTYSYYQMKKHLYKERYYENKRKEQYNLELYKKYGGEKEYYRQQYIKFAFIKTENKNGVEGDKSPLYIGGGPPIAKPEPDITLARADARETPEFRGATDGVDGVDIGALDKDGGATRLETEPVVASAGLDGATDCCAGTDLVVGATPVVG